jgi:hypothetical protein
MQLCGIDFGLIKIGEVADSFLRMKCRMKSERTIRLSFDEDETLAQNWKKELGSIQSKASKIPQIWQGFFGDGKDRSGINQPDNHRNAF